MVLPQIALQVQIWIEKYLFAELYSPYTSLDMEGF